MENSIYFDYAAATPLDDEVLSAMLPFFSQEFYNPSSNYMAARRVQKKVEEARANIARWVGAKPAEIIFTAGATEANNLALHGVMQRFPGANVLVAATEHEATLAPARDYTHELIPVDHKGTIDIVLLQNLIDERTVLISVAIANNEIGTVQPLREIARLIAKVREERRAIGNELPLYLHTDAAQGGSYLDLHAARLGVDLMTLNGGKMYGPKQVGILYVNAHVALRPQISGGKQERGLRSGTENVPGIIGFAKALEKAQATRKESIMQVQRLRDLLQAELLREFPEAIVNGNQKKRLPNNLHISFPGKDGERLLMAADEKGLLIATGAACSANRQTTGSHVLKAIGLDQQAADGSLRLTLGAHSTEQEVNRAVAILKEVIGT